MVTNNAINASSSGMQSYDGAGTWVGRTITAGTGCTVTNGTGTAGNPTIDVTGGGFTPVDATSATYTLLPNTLYVTDRGGGVVYTLPASGTFGDVIKIVGKLGTWSIAENANQSIVLGSLTSTPTTGGLASTNVGDCVTIVCTTAGASTIWTVNAVVGNITVT